MQGVLETFYRVFQDQFMGSARVASAGDLIAPLQDVVFDYKGEYYAAVPLDFREENYERWREARANAPSFESSLALEKSRYLAAIFAIIEGEKLVRLIGEERGGLFSRSGAGGLDEATVRAKLDKQGSMYAQADAFRIYRFRSGAWADLLIQAVGSAAAREDLAHSRNKNKAELRTGWLNGSKSTSLPASEARREEQRGAITALDDELESVGEHRQPRPQNPVKGRSDE